MAEETPEERVERLKREAEETRVALQKNMKRQKKSRARIEREQAKIAERKLEIERLRNKKRNLAKRLAHAIQRLAPTFAPAMLGGHPGVAAKLSTVIAHGVVKFDLSVTSTGDGVHATNSFHFTHPPRAVDLAAPMTPEGIERMKKFQRFAAEKWSTTLFELFGPDNFHFKNGVRIPGAFPDHDDHVHVAR
jgi:hypothetical protein